MGKEEQIIKLDKLTREAEEEQIIKHHISTSTKGKDVSRQHKQKHVVKEKKKRGHQVKLSDQHHKA